MTEEILWHPEGDNFGILMDDEGLYVISPCCLGQLEATKIDEYKGVRCTTRFCENTWKYKDLHSVRSDWLLDISFEKCRVYGWTELDDWARAWTKEPTMTVRIEF